MHIKLYPAEQETIQSADELLHQLHQDGYTCQIKRGKDIWQKITVQGPVSEISRYVRAWLDQCPGRTVTPITFEDPFLYWDSGTTLLDIRAPSLGFTQ